MFRSALVVLKAKARHAGQASSGAAALEGNSIDLAHAAAASECRTLRLQVRALHAAAFTVRDGN